MDVPDALLVFMEPVRLGEPTQAWCDSCALPSAWDVPFALVWSDSLLIACRVTIRWCQDCGRQREVVPDAGY